MKSRKRKDKELKFARLFSFSSRPRLSILYHPLDSLHFIRRAVISNLSNVIRLARIIHDARGGKGILQISTPAPLNY